MDHRTHTIALSVIIPPAHNLTAHGKEKKKQTKRTQKTNGTQTR